MTDVLVPFVNYLVILDNEGERMLAKYYDGKSKADQLSNEASLHKKTKAIAARHDVEVMINDGEILCFKSGADCKFFISGSVDENELILVNMLDVIYDTLDTVLKGQLDKRTMLEHLELILLTIDETLDNGQIMELDSEAVSSRVMMRHSEGGSSNSSQGNNSIGDITISQGLGILRDQLLKSVVNRDGY